MLLLPPPLAAKASGPAALASRGKHCIALTCCSGKVLSGKIRCTIFSLLFFLANFFTTGTNHWAAGSQETSTARKNGQASWHVWWSWNTITLPPSAWSGPLWKYGTCIGGIAHVVCNVYSQNPASQAASSVTFCALAAGFGLCLALRFCLVDGARRIPSLRLWIVLSGALGHLVASDELVEVLLSQQLHTPWGQTAGTRKQKWNRNDYKIRHASDKIIYIEPRHGCLAVSFAAVIFLSNLKTWNGGERLLEKRLNSWCLSNFNYPFCKKAAPRTAHSIQEYAGTRPKPKTISPAHLRWPPRIPQTWERWICTITGMQWIRITVKSPLGVPG